MVALKVKSEDHQRHYDSASRDNLKAFNHPGWITNHAQWSTVPNMLKSFKFTPYYLGLYNVINLKIVRHLHH